MGSKNESFSGRLLSRRFFFYKRKTVAVNFFNWKKTTWEELKTPRKDSAQAGDSMQMTNTLLSKFQEYRELM